MPWVVVELPPTYAIVPLWGRVPLAPGYFAMNFFLLFLLCLLDDVPFFPESLTLFFLPPLSGSSSLNSLASVAGVRDGSAHYSS